jgi:hypothetical protein
MTIHSLHDSIALEEQIMVPSYFVRVFYLIVAWCTIALTFKTPSSLPAVLAVSDGLTGKFFATVFCITFSILLVDVIVNDFMPRRFKLPGARNYRWLFMSLMSLSYFLFAVLALVTGTITDGSWILVAHYIAVGSFGLWFSVYAKFKRYERQIAERHYVHQ